VFPESRKAEVEEEKRADLFGSLFNLGKRKEGDFSYSALFPFG